MDKCVLVTGTAERVCDHMVCAFLYLWDLGCLETSGQLGAIRHDHHEQHDLKKWNQITKQSLALVFTSETCSK